MISLCSLYVCVSICSTCVYFKHIFSLRFAIRPFCHAHLAQIHNLFFSYLYLTETINFNRTESVYRFWNGSVFLLLMWFVVITAQSTPTPPPSPSPLCRPEEISCDGQCYPPQIRCNGYAECRNGIDEQNCPNSISTTQSPPLTVISHSFIALMNDTVQQMLLLLPSSATIQYQWDSADMNSAL